MKKLKIEHWEKVINRKCRQEGFKQIRSFGAYYLKDGDGCLAVAKSWLIFKHLAPKEFNFIKSWLESRLNAKLETRFKTYSVYCEKDYISARVRQSHGCGYSWNTEIEQDFQCYLRENHIKYNKRYNLNFNF